jgi:predicted ATP-dependent serine protease
MPIRDLTEWGQKPVTDRFACWAMDKQERERMRELKYYVPGLIVKGYHTFIFGPAGSGKTAVMLHLGGQIAKDHTDVKIIYFYLDGALSTAALASERFEALGLHERVKLLTGGTMADYTNELKRIIEDRDRLDNTIFVLDTFKFLSNDINNKTSNKDAMHFIKRLQTLGATFISLGHTNKDGKRESGTAEIEQDSDVVLRIDGEQRDGKQTSTIKCGGRCRADIMEASFEFIPGEVGEVKQLSEVVDVEASQQREKQRAKDQRVIDGIRQLLHDNGGMNQSAIVAAAKESDELAGTPVKTIRDVLIRWTDHEWTVKPGDKGAKVYSLHDRGVGESIERIQARIS